MRKVHPVIPDCPLKAPNTRIPDALRLCLQVVSCRLQMTKGLLQKAAEEQGASEAIGDKLINKGITLMESMAALVDR